MFGQFIEAVMFIYEHRVLPDEIPTSYRNASVESILADRERLRIEEAAKPEPLPAQDPEARVMPHHPDPKSMRTYLAAADIAIEREGPTHLITSGTKRFIVGQQYLVRSLIAYWLRHQTTPILKEFRFGVTLNWDGIVSGYPAHIWDLQQLFWDSVVARNERVTAALIDRAEDAWNLAQTRPVPWLTARLRCMFTLHRQSKVAIGAYFEDFRLAAFVDKLPPELDKDVPLIHNSYRLLVAARDQAWPTLEERLAERMELLVKHFWRQVTPAALVDTFGLSVARWARERGYRIQLRHVYLPLDWLDVPVESTPAG